jgi:hypothetical protein
MTEYSDVEDRDSELGHALRDLAMPPQNPEFWSDLRANLLASAELDVGPPSSSASEAVSEDLFQTKQNEVMPTKTPHRPDLVDVSHAPEHRDRPSWMIGVAASVLLLVGVIGYQFFTDQDESVVLIDTADGTPSETGVPDASVVVPTTDARAAVAPAIDEAVLGDLLYPSDWDLEAGAIQLTDGRWEGEPEDGAGSTFPVVTLTDHIVSPSDENSAIAVLAGDGGGSGTFYQLYVITKQADESFHVSQPVDLGDRITFATLTFDGATVVAIYTDGFGDTYDQQFTAVDGKLD